MKKRVGIPCGLFYHKYYPLWKSFLEELGAEVVLSENTNRRILDAGVSLCVDEACLPVKLFLGHAASLIGKVDYLFVPRFTSISRHEYICPEFGGLPDTVRHSLGIENSPVLIDVEVNMIKSERCSWKSASETAGYLTDDRKLARMAYKKAIGDYRLYRKKVMGEVYESLPVKQYPNGKNIKNVSPAGKEDLKIAVIGHSYNIYDRYINMDMLGKLEKMGARAVTVEMVDEADINMETEGLRKPMFWNYGRKALGSSMYFIRNAELDGIIYLMSFGCGIDSFVCDMVARRVRMESNTPFIVVTIDEHSGEAGLNTRLEAFIDMIRWKKQLGGQLGG